MPTSPMTPPTTPPTIAPALFDLLELDVAVGVPEAVGKKLNFDEG